MSAYSTHFSISTSSAGSDDSKARASAPSKPSIGLGLGLPSDVLATSVHAHEDTGLGLGIHIDSWLPDSPESSEPSPSVSPTMPSLPLPSPPLLAPRRSPRKPPAETPGSEFAPMRTPSPSLRGHFAGGGGGGYFVIKLPAPAVPTLPSTPTLPAGPFPGGGGGDGGGNLAGLGIIEVSEWDVLMSPFRQAREADTTGSKLVGLGLSLPCLDEAELITTFEPQSTTYAAGVGAAVDLSFLSDDTDTSDDSELDSELDFELEGALPSPWSRAASTSPGHLKSARSYRCVGLALDGEEEGECQSGPDGASPRASSCEGPTLGFDSPFWATYASTFHEES